jgi:hypothetical protein
MYSKINSYLQEDEFINPWPELIDFIISIINEKPKHILMPGVIAAAYGADEASQVGANSVITLLYAAIIAVDSILDGDEIGPAGCGPRKKRGKRYSLPAALPGLPGAGAGLW